MNYETLKKQANEILINQSAECAYIEYKKSSLQLDKILKTICAYGNNYHDNDIQFIFLGVEEANDENNKAIPKLPIEGIKKGSLEKCRNEINRLRSFLYPKVSFEIIANQFKDVFYLLIAVPRQTGGPFMVSERAEKDKKIKLKPGRYVRIESESRLARVDEEYDLLRKFANYHFSSLTHSDASLDDLNSDYLYEYLSMTSDRETMASLSKIQLAKSLHLLDRNDPTEKKVKNFALLMFANNPERFIPYAYIEFIIDMYGTKRKMESKRLSGPIWKQYHTAVSYINDRFINTMTLREDGESVNRTVSNFPFIAVEELVANAIVHNNFENAKPIQIYVSENQINIVNYNKPLPPLRLNDLNERTFFNERDTENPEIRDMFKSLGIIESFGTGIGEAKKALERNGSPQLYYKIFEQNDNVTSVVIPASEEYQILKSGGNPKKKTGIDKQTQDIQERILKSPYNRTIKQNIAKLYDCLGDEVFGNSKVADLLQCSEATATSYLRRMHNELFITTKVEGAGKGKYKFMLGS